jgi:hypothetical protein
MDLLDNTTSEFLLNSVLWHVVSSARAQRKDMHVNQLVG